MTREHSRGGVKWGAGALAVLAVAYFALFVVAWLDEMVFETYWLEAYLPETLYDGLDVLMVPVAWLLDQFGI